MAKKSSPPEPEPVAVPTGPQITEEKTDWGVRLIVKPFPDEHYSTLEIEVDIATPRPGRGAEMRTRFSAVPVSMPLRATDVIVWMAQMNAIQMRAREIAADMKKKESKKKAKR